MLRRASIELQAAFWPMISRMMDPASGWTRKRTAWATSSGSQKRLTGIFSSIA